MSDGSRARLGIPTLALALAGCASGGTGIAAGAGAVVSGDTGVEGLDATLWMQHAAEYGASAEQAYRIASDMLAAALEDSSWTAAPEQRSDASALPPAIILDVDETVLDNSPFQARLIIEGREFNPQIWGEWIDQAAAAPVPGALAFARQAAAQGVMVFYVTNRDANMESSTRRNLERHEFPLAPGEDVILTRGEHEGWGSDKSSRRAYVAARYRVLLLVGDDLNDFVTVTRSSAEERDQIATDHAAFWGRKWIILPNPTYGSWERALYGFDSSLSPEEKRRRKAENLNTGAGSDDEGLRD
ncbi:MAG: HAD family acid phosphatase [Gemmatimonadota bacterium]